MAKQDISSKPVQAEAAPATAQKRSFRPRALVLGVITLLFALVGLVTTVVWLVGLIGKRSE